MCYNNLEDVPPQLGMLSAMERLLLSDNKIAVVPEEVREGVLHAGECLLFSCVISVAYRGGVVNSSAC